MNSPPPPFAPSSDATEEWVVTVTSGGLVTKIEAIDTATQQRTDVSAYAGLPASNAGASPTEEMVVTTNNLIVKIEKIDKATRGRMELSREEYAGLIATMGLTAYYAGIRDYALALATGDMNAAQTYYTAMTDYFAGIGGS